MWYCTDVMDKRTKAGFERALVLERCHDDANKIFYRRVGILEHYQADTWNAGAERVEITIH